jgi:hypothetical protein
MWVSDTWGLLYPTAGISWIIGNCGLYSVV